MGEKSTAGQKGSGIRKHGISPSRLSIPDIQEKKVMAKVVPYGDAEAHGSLACSLTFRRSRGKVILEKKPYTKQPNTPAQVEQKERFRDCWQVYHGLTAWAVEYLEKKAAELGTTKANLFMSQCLKDEIPSTCPSSWWKEIIDISLPEPVATEDEGLKIEPFSFVDIGEVETSYGHIHDKLNIFSPGTPAGEHQRELIRLLRTYDSVLHIPFNYPVIVTWKAFNDEEYVSLIRLPEMDIEGGELASDTPMTDVKEITAVNLISTITGSTKTINFQFLTYKTSNQQYQGLGNIWDNENIFRPGALADPYDKIFLQIDDIETPPSTIPEDYELEISYKNFSDDMQHIHVKLPTFQLAAGTAPSTNPLTNIKTVTAMFIGRTIGALGGSIYHAVSEHDPPNEKGRELGQILDYANFFSFINYGTEAEENMMEFRKVVPNRDIMENYYIDISYTDFGEAPHSIRVWYPYWPVPTDVWTRLYLADDLSLYSDLALTTLVKPSDPNRKRLWIADDWSLYWDSDFLNLAKSMGGVPVDLWIAKDFSLYWDKALTQLASTPFF